MTSEANPDVALFGRLVRDGGPIPVDTNALAVALGAELIAYDSERREIAMRFRPGASFLQGAGVVQGGAVSAMLDFAMAFAAFSVLPEGSTVVTTTMSTSFMGAASGDDVDVTGRVDKPGRRVVFTSAELRSRGRLAASATSTLLVVPAG